MTALLEVRDLDVRYGEAQVIAGVSFELRPGELLSVVGANGAGKTTLVHAITGLVRPHSGSVRFAGREISGRSSADICEMGIGQVPEGRQIFPSLTVMENLLLGADLRRARRRRGMLLARMLELFPRLAERRRQQAGTLSGGEQQMLAIARCLMADPELLLFDEPSLGLAPVVVEEIFGIMQQLRRDGRTVLLVEQNVALSLGVCDRACVLENGRMVLEGRGSDLLGNEHVRRAYLGL